MHSYAEAEVRDDKRRVTVRNKSGDGRRGKRLDSHVCYRAHGQYFQQAVHKAATTSIIFQGKRVDTNSVSRQGRAPRGVHSVRFSALDA